VGDDEDDGSEGVEGFCWVDGFGFEGVVGMGVAAISARMASKFGRRNLTCTSERGMTSVTTSKLVDPIRRGM